jgi:hypothetical protein
MLNDEKKALIEAEEHYRHEVARKLRADLDAVALAAQKIETTIWSKLNDFLNSNVGTWLLSTVLVTGGAGAYQIAQHHYEKIMHDRTQMVTHQFEIGNRIQNMKYFLRKAQTVGDAEFALKSIFQSKSPVTPEVEKIILSVLYFNFYQIKGPHNKEALELVRKLEDQYYILQNQKQTDPLSDDERTKLLGWVEQLERIQIQETGSN